VGGIKIDSLWIWEENVLVMGVGWEILLSMGGEKKKIRVLVCTLIFFRCIIVIICCVDSSSAA